jgi:hypothetical protein
LKREQKKTEAAGLSLHLRTRSTKLFEADMKVLQRSQQEERGKPLCRHCKSFGGTISIGAAPTVGYVWCKGKYVQVILLQVGSCIFIGTYRTGRCMVHFVQWHVTQSAEEEGRALAVCGVLCANS